MIDKQSNDAQASGFKRKASWWLIGAIVVIPYVGAWFTLKSGYSKLIRILAFSWMGLAIIGAMLPRHTSKSPETSPAQADEVTEQVVAVPLSPAQANRQMIDSIDAKGGRCSQHAFALRNELQMAERFGNDTRFLQALGRATEEGC